MGCLSAMAEAHRPLRRSSARRMAHQLDARSSTDVSRVLKSLLAHPGTQDDVRRDFPHVVKCVNVERSDAKRLVYAYLARHAETCPEETLLAVNAFQKELAGRDPHMRALALKVMSSVRLPVLLPLQVDAIRRSAADRDRRVRRCAAMALHKVHMLDQMAMQDGMEVLERLLTDEDDDVIATAVMVMQKLAPDQWQVLHPHYRNLCARLANWDTWGQVYGMNLLHGYARRYLMPREVKPCPTAEDDRIDTAKEKLEDLNLLLKVCKTLLLSQSPAVVLGAAEVLLDAGEEEQKARIGEALVLSFLTGGEEIKTILLQNIFAICKVEPRILQSHTRHFYPKAHENFDVFQIKLSVLELLVNEDNARGILVSFLSLLEGSQMGLRKGPILRTLGNIACKIPELACICMGELLQHVFDSDEQVSLNAIHSIQVMYKNNMTQHVQTVLTLCSKYHALPTPQIKARLLSLLVADLENPHKKADMGSTEISDLHLFALEIARHVACNFLLEEEEVRLQALSVCAKLSPVYDQANDLFSALASLSEVDANVGTRDRARFLSAVTRANAIDLLCERPEEADQIRRQDCQYRLSTLSLIVGHKAPGYMDLPEFSNDGYGPLARVRMVNMEQPSKDCLPQESQMTPKKASLSPAKEDRHNFSQVDIDSFYDDIEENTEAT